MEHIDSIQKALEFIENRLTDTLNVRDIVSHVNFSQYHYQRIFASFVGEPIMEYVKKRRLSLAALELCDTDYPIIDIALKYGYGSHEGFTRAFKSYHGITPAKCRKYRLFHYFNKKQLQRELIALHKNANLMNISDVLPVSMVEKLIKNTDAIYKLLFDFKVHAKDSAELIIKKECELNLQGGLYKQIAKETLELANKADARANQYRNSLYGVTEQSRYMTFPEFSGQLFGLLETLDDLNWLIHLISFNLYLNIAKIPRCSRESFSDVVAAYKSLTFELSAGHIKIERVIKDFWKLVSLDIQKEIQKRIEFISGKRTELINKAQSLALFIRDEAANNIENNGSISVIADEMGYIASALQNNELYNACALKVKLLKYTLIFEMQYLDQKSIQSAIKQMDILWEEFHHADEEIADLNIEIEQLKGLLSPEKSDDDTIKLLEDTLFHANILYFCTKTEYAKFKYIATDDQVIMFSDLLDRVCNATAKFYELLMNKKAENTENIAFSSIVDMFQSFTCDMHKVADIIGEAGDPFKYIATEYGFFTDKLKKTAEQN